MLTSSSGSAADARAAADLSWSTDAGSRTNVSRSTLTSSARPIPSASETPLTKTGGRKTAGSSAIGASFRMSAKPPTIASSGIASSGENSGGTRAGSSLGGSVMNPPFMPTDPSDDLQQKVTTVSIARALMRIGVGRSHPHYEPLANSSAVRDSNSNP